MATDGHFGKRVMWVLWPAFLLAGVAETLFFTFVDPMDLSLFGAPLDLSRQAIYTLGFFVFWALCAGSSALTVFLGASPWETHRCPLDSPDRPSGCPKRAGDSATVPLLRMERSGTGNAGTTGNA